MIQIYNKALDKTAEYETGKSLMEICLENSWPLDHSCQGYGQCGKCKLKILEGNPGVISSDEKKILRQEEIDDRIRLACCVFPKENLTIETSAVEEKIAVLVQGYLPSFTRDDLDGLGAAVDIGTTTVAACLVDLSTGEILAKSSMSNPQRKYGQDVMSRIAFEYEQEQSGIDLLQASIVEGLNDLLTEMTVSLGCLVSDILQITVAANTTMLHLLLGVDARSLGRAPYQPVFTSMQELPASEVGLHIAPNGILTCLPSVSAYIGADIVAGVGITELAAKKGHVLFLDIGTNGEMALSTNGRLLCCSCAAGPALEGMNISCGMRGVAGAIQDLSISPNEIILDVIGNVTPVGLCGSGILAAVRELLTSGIVKKTGTFQKIDGVRELVLSEAPLVKVTSSDVRQVQLAKGALLSGVMALLSKAGLTPADLDQVLVAGQFGSYIPARSFTITGILPMELEEKITYVGNTSMSGAYAALLSGKIRTQMEEISEKMDDLELSALEGYDRLFAKCMTFPELGG